MGGRRRTTNSVRFDDIDQSFDDIRQMREEFEAQNEAENSLEDHVPNNNANRLTEPPKNKPVDELMIKDELRSPSQMTKESGYFSNPRSTNPSGKLSLLNVSFFQRIHLTSTDFFGQVKHLLRIIHHKHSMNQQTILNTQKPIKT